MCQKMGNPSLLVIQVCSITGDCLLYYTCRCVPAVESSCHGCVCNGRRGHDRCKNQVHQLRRYLYEHVSASHFFPLSFTFCSSSSYLPICSCSSLPPFPLPPPPPPPPPPLLTVLIPDGLVDDGTGAIRCNWWRQTDCHDNMHEHEPSIRHGNLVTVFGTIAMYKDKREITIDLISM